MGKLQDKVALVTGGATGIGKGIVRVFAKEGAKVVFVGRREEKGKAAEEELRAEGYDVCFHKADVSKEEDIKEMIQFTLDKYGKLDILVNNAAVMVTASIIEQTTEQINQTFDTNVIGYILACKYALPHMKAGGAIVNTGSLGGSIAGVLATSYSPSKAAVIHFTRTLAKEIAGLGIRVNCVSPGPVWTEMVADSQYTNGQSPEEIAKGMVPLQRFGTPEDLGNAFAFLASDEAAFITGINLLVDGGVGA